MKRQLIIIIVGIFNFFTTSAQVQVNKAELREIERIQDSIYKSNQQLIKKLIINNPKSNLRIHSSDKLGEMSLQRILPNGHPVYYATFNQDAAKITNISKLQPGGTLGLGLTGQGVPLAVWDGGLVANHIEFEKRLEQLDGEILSNHATHVTGTLIAAGINPQAKGMASKAFVRSHDFNNDLSEIANEAIRGTVISNHSYGMVNGWNINDNGNWEWFGDASVSNIEDYSFGFYDYKARELDKITYNAPYYTLVWAAGNDRDDVGNGTIPPDGNGGNGFDCVSPEATAKNIITIGAINKFTEYEDPGSIPISEFSAWGPTDDGRIKPDLVGVGVDLYSTSSAVENGYTYLSGTSMATPNVAGGLTLLQELHMNLYGTYMKSSTLKALAIHTAKEAGQYEGPDYVFGWGLFDAGKAAQLLLQEESSENITIGEYTLNNREVVLFDLYAEKDTPVKLTLAWTDPHGNPVQPTLDPQNLMLVNDLDVKLIDDTGREFYPWILDPSKPNSPAQKSVNIRDNIEKLEFIVPQSRKYTVVINHKGDLLNEYQDFSLIIEHTALLADDRQAYYWIGDTGDWSNGGNWSFKSGGEPVNAVPGVDSYAIFDDNSFSTMDEVVSITSDVDLFGLIWLPQKSGAINLNDNSLVINENLRVEGDSMNIKSSGRIKFRNNSTSFLSGKIYAPDIHFLFDNDNEFLLNGTIIADSLTFADSNVIINSSLLEVSNLYTAPTFSGSLYINNSIITEVKNIFFNDADYFFEGTTIHFSTFEESQWQSDDIIFSGPIISNNMLQIKGQDNSFQNITTSGKLEIIGDNRIDSLILIGSSLSIHYGDTLTVGTYFNAINENTIQSTGMVKSFMNILVQEKFCFNSLDVSFVDLIGVGAVSVGENSNITNADNWSPLNCEDLVLPRFSWNNGCAGGLTEFINTSSGKVMETTWHFNESGDEVVLTGDTVYYSFLKPGEYEVELRVQGAMGMFTTNEFIQITSNNTPENHIINNKYQLASFRPAASYQWFYDGSPLNNENNRILDDPVEGDYFVVNYYESCNRVSDTLQIRVTGITAKIIPQIILYPVPVDERLNINSNVKINNLSIISSEGNLILKIEAINKNHESIKLENLPIGYYLLSIETQYGISTHKFIKL